MKQQWHSGFDDSSGWGRLIDPICLFILSQIAGTIWVIVPRKAFDPPVVPSAAVEVHHAEVNGMTHEKAALEKAIRIARQELTTLALPAKAEVTDKDRLNAQIRAEEQQFKELEAKLGELSRKEADLTGRIAATPAPRPQTTADVNQLAELLASRQSEVKRLQMALDQAKGTGGSGVGSPRILNTNLRPELLHLTGNRARPVNDENYKVVESGLIKGTNRKAQRISPKTPGETVDDIKKPGSKLAEFLRKLDPDKQYVLCLLTSDSFQIFREVRRIAGEQRIKVGWDTDYRTDGTLTLSEGTGKARGPGETVGR